MAENINHTVYTNAVLCKYVLRLMDIEEAKSFEAHFSGCNQCVNNLTDITNFFEQLQQALKIGNSQDYKDIATTTSPPTQVISSDGLAVTFQELFCATNNIKIDALISITLTCFNGFQKLRKNIATRTQLDTNQIDQATIEILLALPAQVSKIDQQKHPLDIDKIANLEKS